MNIYLLLAWYSCLTCWSWYCWSKNILGVHVWLHHLHWSFQRAVSLWRHTLDRTRRLPLPLRSHLRHPQARPQRQRRMEGHRQRSPQVLTDGQVRDLPFPGFRLPTFGSVLPEQVHAEARLPSDAGLRSLRPLQGRFHRRLQVRIGLLLPRRTTLNTLWTPYPSPNLIWYLIYFDICCLFS